ncbi:retrovirus-related pol polyprotein from transposon TNT 1-94 [Tanacetum coccineum]
MITIPSSLCLQVILLFVNTLGYPCTLRNMSAMFVNALYQPWRAILSMINMCLTGKTTGYDRPRHPFVQSIQTFLTDMKNLATASRGKKNTDQLLIPNVRFTKLIIHHLKNKHNIHPRPGSALHYSHEENILNTLRYVGKDGREIFEHDKADDKYPEPASSQPPKQTPTPTESSKKDQAGKVTKKRMPKSSLQLVDDVVDEGVLEKEPAHDDEEANLQRALELSLKEQGERTQGLARPVVIREPDSGRIQPLPEAGSNPGDAVESQLQPSHVVHDGPNLEHMELEITDASTQQKPEQMDEEFTTTAYLNVQENLKLLTEDQVILEEPASSTRTLSSLQNLDKDLSFTDQFFVEKPQEEEPGKTNAEAEVQSMVSVPIHQDTSSVPPMTTPVIDLTKSQSGLSSTNINSNNLNNHNNNLNNHNNNNSSTTTSKHHISDPSSSHWDCTSFKSVELDYSNQCLANQEEARKKKRKRRESPRTPPGSPLHTTSTTSLAGAFGASSTSGSAQQQGSQALSSSKTAALASQSCTFVDDEDSENDHQPKADLRKDWWKPLPKEERPTTPEPA